MKFQLNLNAIPNTVFNYRIKLMVRTSLETQLINHYLIKKQLKKTKY